ncbi:hypothetical protein MASR1M90_07020 [Desulfovibrionales bacterium]
MASNLIVRNLVVHVETRLPLGVVALFFWFAIVLLVDTTRMCAIAPKKHQAQHTEKKYVKIL